MCADPLLSGHLAKAWVEGVQSCKVMATPKHFLANEQEHMRRSSNSVIDERTMQEIYLEPFRHQMKADPKVFVSRDGCIRVPCRCSCVERG
jgi:beta-glucosidase